MLKAAQSWTSPSFLIGGILYGLGAFIWLVILRTFPLSIAFPIASGVLMMGTSATGFFILKESFSLQNAVGIFLIFAGISLLAVNMEAK